MLSDYDIEIRHVKGSVNGRADTLSRRPDYDQGSDDNSNITVLPDSVFVRTIEVVPEELSQNNNMIKPWVNPHNLKHISGSVKKKVSEKSSPKSKKTCISCHVSDFLAHLLTAYHWDCRHFFLSNPLPCALLDCIMWFAYLTP